MKYLIANIMDSGENMTGELYWVASYDECTAPLPHPPPERVIFKSKGHTKKQHHEAICQCLDWVEQKESGGRAAPDGGGRGFSVELSFNHNPIASRQFMKELREKHPDSFKQDPNVSNLPPALQTPQLPQI